MKKILALFFCAIACTIILFSCKHGGNDVSLSYNDSESFYSMNASFNESKTREVEQYIDSRIGSRSNMSFVNTKIDGTISLDDHTTIYMKKSPGILKIELDKGKNSYEAFRRIRSMCEGLKNVLVK